MRKQVTIELHKEDMKFSAGHFTIFSASERENLHGHNYQVHVTLVATVDDNGLAFNYRTYKAKIRKICDSLDEYMLLPELSPHLKIKANKDGYQVLFAKEKLQFLARDVKLLPLRNITVEELSGWFVEQLAAKPKTLLKDGISEISVKVFSGHGQCGVSTLEL